jgi:hypothetical protein
LSRCAHVRLRMRTCAPACAHARAQLEVLCGDKVCGNEHTLDFVYRTLWPAGSAGFGLEYRRKTPAPAT